MVEKEMTRVKAIILDFDHTLVMSKVDFAEMKRMIIDYLRAEGIPVTEADVNKLTYEITAGAVEHLKKQKREGEINRILGHVDDIRSEVEMKSADQASPIKGAKDTLQYLQSKGFKIGILTRGCRSYVTQVLTSSKMKEYVDEIAARDDCDNPKPDPTQMFILMDKMGANRSETIMVGDHPTDAQCAKNAGVRFIGVRTGSWGSDLTKRLGSTVIDSITTLPELLVEGCRLAKETK